MEHALVHLNCPARVVVVPVENSAQPLSSGHQQSTFCRAHKHQQSSVPSRESTRELPSRPQPWSTLLKEKTSSQQRQIKKNKRCHVALHDAQNGTGPQSGRSMFNQPTCDDADETNLPIDLLVPKLVLMSSAMGLPNHFVSVSWSLPAHPLRSAACLPSLPFFEFSCTQRRLFQFSRILALVTPELRRGWTERKALRRTLNERVSERRWRQTRSAASE
mmetsp:Transcript_11026/g.17919  ORF Transcript_11026/g.17919 Transcript_11026/m.17919 type:complete len:218 (+) Transcript_11026:91-744(+)